MPENLKFSSLQSGSKPRLSTRAVFRLWSELSGLAKSPGHCGKRALELPVFKVLPLIKVYSPVSKMGMSYSNKAELDINKAVPMGSVATPSLSTCFACPNLNGKKK
jgi:hypothetical protein